GWDSSGETSVPAVGGQVVEPVYDIFLNEGQNALLIRTRQNVSLRDSRTGYLLNEFSHMDWHTTALAWVPDSQYFLASNRTGRVSLMDRRYEHAVVFSAVAHQSDVHAIAVSQTGTLAASGSKQHLCLWDLKQQ